jgi:hypothetical protein
LHKRTDTIFSSPPALNSIKKIVKRNEILLLGGNSPAIIVALVKSNWGKNISDTPGANKESRV